MGAKRNGKSRPEAACPLSNAPGSGADVRLAPTDVCALTPLVWGHVSPNGAFDLDMERRLDLDALAPA